MFSIRIVEDSENARTQQMIRNIVRRLESKYWRFGKRKSIRIVMTKTIPAMIGRHFPCTPHLCITEVFNYVAAKLIVSLFKRFLRVASTWTCSAYRHCCLFSRLPFVDWKTFMPCHRLIWHLQNTLVVTYYQDQTLFAQDC